MRMVTYKYKSIKNELNAIYDHVTETSHPSLLSSRKCGQQDGFIAFYYYQVVKLNVTRDPNTTNFQFKFSNDLSICHWNRNVPKYFSLRLLLQFTSLILFVYQKHYLDSDTPSDESKLEISGYNFVRLEHPPNSKQGYVCIYYKNLLPLRILNI